MWGQASCSCLQAGCWCRPGTIQAASAKVGVLTQEGSCPDLPISFRRSSELEASTWHIRITGILCPLS